jgi:hypothetical protein
VRTSERGFWDKEKPTFSLIGINLIIQHAQVSGNAVKIEAIAKLEKVWGRAG